MQAFREWMETNIDLSTYQVAAATSVEQPLFSEEFMGTHTWPSPPSATKKTGLPTVPRCMEIVHMQSMMMILRARGKINYLHRKETFYNIIRKKFATFRVKWTHKVRLSYSGPSCAKLNELLNFQICTGQVVNVGCEHLWHEAYPMPGCEDGPTFLVDISREEMQKVKASLDEERAFAKYMALKETYVDGGKVGTLPRKKAKVVRLPA